MAWKYSQSSGDLRSGDGQFVSQGYAGAAAGKNNAAMQSVHNVGPLPRGNYTILPPVDTMTHGPYVLWLEPDHANEMFGRSAFGIHGDSVRDPGSASEGCVILPRWARMAIWRSGDHVLQVE